jgi:hypothetical protein
MAHVLGVTSLIMNNFANRPVGSPPSSKAKDMEDKQRKIPMEKKGAKDPYKEFLEALYIDDSGHFVMPSTAFKGAMIDACRQVEGATMKASAGAFHIMPQWIRIYGHPVPQRDPARNATGVIDLRYRPYFHEWAAIIPITINSNVLSVAQIINLLDVAGFACGIGDWRPSSKKNYSGNHGLFRVANEDEVKPILEKYEEIRIPTREEAEEILHLTPVPASHGERAVKVKK